MRSWRSFCTAHKLFLAALGVLVVSTGISLCIGSVWLTFGQLLRGVLGQDVTATSILYHVRLPRVGSALVAGAAFSCSGAIIQQVLQNPLAGPNIIGINAGSALFVTVGAAFFPVSLTFSPVLAFLGAGFAMGAILLIGKKADFGKLSIILSGVAVGAMINALTDIVITLVPDTALATSAFKIGGFAGATAQRLWPCALVVVCSLALCIIASPRLQVLSLGSDTAYSLGLNVKWTRGFFLSVACALAGAGVSLGGLIGFVGLLVPHMVRRIVKESNFAFLPLCALFGAVFLNVCDTMARAVFSPFEVPVGILLSLIGGPFFIYLLFSRRRGI